jgi:CHAD domain-containing protein
MAKARAIEDLSAGMGYAQAAARTVAVRAEEVFEHREGVLDMTDIERVHAMRVATRRLRAVLEVYAPCFPKKQLRPALRDVKALADALGARRDPDVELLALEAFAASVGPDERAGVEVFIARTRAEQRAGNERLAAALELVERDDLRGRLSALAAAASARSAPEPEPEAEPEPEDAPPDARADEGPRAEPAPPGGAPDHPHGLGVLEGEPPAGVNQDTGF